jgi:hypothetical protein
MRGEASPTAADKGPPRSRERADRKGTVGCGRHHVRGRWQWLHGRRLYGRRLPARGRRRRNALQRRRRSLHVRRLLEPSRLCEHDTIPSCTAHVHPPAPLHWTASTTGMCFDAHHVFVSDRAGDNGGEPSNQGGEAFWESPDNLPWLRLKHALRQPTGRPLLRPETSPRGKLAWQLATSVAFAPLPCRSPSDDRSAPAAGRLPRNAPLPAQRRYSSARSQERPDGVAGASEPICGATAGASCSAQATMVELPSRCRSPASFRGGARAIASNASSAHPATSLELLKPAVRS